MVLSNPSWSFLGQVYLAMERSDDALAASQKAIDLLAEQKTVEEVQQIYLNHYRVLQAAGSSEAAEALEKGRAAMMEQADAISNMELRETFLERPQVNRARWSR